MVAKRIALVDYEAMLDRLQETGYSIVGLQWEYDGDDTKRKGQMGTVYIDPLTCGLDLDTISRALDFARHGRVMG